LNCEKYDILFQKAKQKCLGWANEYRERRTFRRLQQHTNQPPSEWALMQRLKKEVAKSGWRELLKATGANSANEVAPASAEPETAPSVTETFVQTT
jgi:hypothetical protein